MDVTTQGFVLQQLERTLDAHVLNQNRTDRLASYPQFIEATQMREVSNLATVLGNTIATLKQASTNATTRFQTEVAHSNANLVKVNAFTDELASANKEVEAMLADTGSNFPDATSSTTSEPDKNGVVTPKG